MKKFVRSIPFFKKGLNNFEAEHARNQGGAFAPTEIFKTLHSNFDICRNFQRIKMKSYILIIFKKFYRKFSLSYW